MPDLPADFDLKLMPDWLKEPASKNPYADYEVRDDERRGRGRGGEGWGGGMGNDRGARPGGGGPPGRAGRNDRGGNRGEARGRKPGRPRRKDGPKAAGAERRSGPRGFAGRARDFRDRRRPAPVQQPANVTIEFFPDEHAAASIAREIKSTHRSYSLFDLARMFLAKPERHRLKISTKSVAEPLYQVGENGPVTLDQAGAERAAFPTARRRFLCGGKRSSARRPRAISRTWRAAVPMGNCSGPPATMATSRRLRKLYDERFSRRMSFAEFQREIEVVNDPALVEQWKEQARTSTVYRLKPPEHEN